MTESDATSYVSRGGEKLAAALDAFDIQPADWVCADLGCNVGGFTDCLLQRGAAKVYAVDTGYGELAWKLRRDARVVTLERTNALHVELPEPVQLVTIDVAWTRQHLIVPAARELLASGGRIVTLIKPHYEAERNEVPRGVLPADLLDEVLQRVRARLAEAGAKLSQTIESPLRGGKGNCEYLGLIESA